MDLGVLGPQEPASSSPPRCSQQHLHLSPGLSSAKMPGPAKPAVPVRHPCDRPPFPAVAPGRPGPSPRARAGSGWVGGGLRQENRVPQLLPHPPDCPTARPVLLTPAPSIVLPPWARGGAPLPPGDGTSSLALGPPKPAPPTSVLSFLLLCSIHSFSDSYRAALLGQALCQALGIQWRTEAENAFWGAQ